jgi:hypothetical protein
VHQCTAVVVGLCEAAGRQCYSLRQTVTAPSAGPSTALLQVLAARLRPASLPAYEALFKTAEQQATKREHMQRAAEAATLKVSVRFAVLRCALAFACTAPRATHARFPLCSWVMRLLLLPVLVMRRPGCHFAQPSCAEVPVKRECVVPVLCSAGVPLPSYHAGTAQGCAGACHQNGG